MSRKDENLKSLGNKTEYRTDYMPEVLEAFENQHPGNDYWVEFLCPEFTSLCPITGQPDFAEIRIRYIPNRKMVESKSLKLYLVSLPSFIASPSAVILHLLLRPENRPFMTPV